MQQTCRRTGEKFEVSERDLAFLDKVSPVIAGKKYQIPPPTLCPSERQRRRMAFRNERSLYNRKCDKTGEQILSMYPQDVDFPVYGTESWFGDSWDAKDYGQDYDFNKPFFEQFVELRKKVPHLALISSNNENCDFCNIVGKCKSCYLIFGSINCQDCYYGNPFNCKDCSDSLVLRNSELCVECVDSDNLYNCYRCQNCTNSQDLKFCFGVDNSKNCFACVDLNRKEYCILNKQYTKEEYERITSEMNLSDPAVLKSVTQKFEALKKTVPHRAYIGTNNENVSGNYIFNSKDTFDSYNASKCQDVAYSSQLLAVKDCMDIDYCEYGELVYEEMGFFNSVQNTIFSYMIWDTAYNLMYSANCTQNVRNCFGCVGLKRSEYCILNKQYTKEEYEALVPKIIEHMRSTKEWGEFFQTNTSLFAYNETAAQEYYPLSKEEAIKRGYSWKDDMGKTYIDEGAEIPKSMEDVADDFASKTLRCEKSGRAYKVLPQELKLYKRMHAPIPRKCPDERHLGRLAQRNPRKLWDRACYKCAKSIKSSHSPQRPETVYCDECYAQAVY